MNNTPTTRLSGVDLSQFSGPWLMSEDRQYALKARLMAGLSRVRTSVEAAPAQASDSGLEADAPSLSGYALDSRTGVARIDVRGVLTKYPLPDDWDFYFGFCPTEPLMAALARAMDDYQVRKVVWVLDGPGGMVAGTNELAEAIARANLVKPQHAVVSDLAASGHYYLASQCSTISCNAMGEVGCIGVYAVLWDISKMIADMGVVGTVVGSGGVKGLGADGKVSQELIADVQRGIDGMYAKFIGDVAKGRKISFEQAKLLGDGRVWIGPEALSRKLIDSVASVDDAIKAIATASAVSPPPPTHPAPPASPSPSTPSSSTTSAAPATTSQTKQTSGDVAGGKAGPTTPALRGGSGRTPQSAKGGKGKNMDPKKRAYLESIGLKPDATEDEANTFYSLLNADQQAAADNAKGDGGDGGGGGGGGDGGGDTAAASGNAPPSLAAGNKNAILTGGTSITQSSGASLPDLVAACDGDKAAACDYFTAGMTVAQATAAYAPVKAAKAELAAKDQEIKRLEYSSGKSSGRPPVNTNGAKKEAAGAPKAGEGEFAKINDPKSRAKAEWAANLDDCQNAFSSEASFVGYRTADLRGQIK